MEKFTRFCSMQCAWTFHTAGTSDAATMAAIMAIMGFNYSDTPLPDDNSPDIRWVVLAFFYSRYMLQSGAAFETMPSVQWPGVHKLSVGLGKVCSAKRCHAFKADPEPIVAHPQKRRCAHTPLA
jgi:hypothetical protein